MRALAYGKELLIGGRRAFFRALPGTDAAAPPLLLVHGISCSTETWEPFLAELSRRPERPAVLVPDLPAHGRSESPEAIFGMADFAGWLEHLLVRLDQPQVDVMGHSMGCQVALALADAYPERVRRMVLLGPTLGGGHVSTPRLFGGLVADSAREPWSYNLKLLRVFWRMGPLRYLRTAFRMQEDDAFEHARRLSAPTLVLQGTRDAIIPKVRGQELAAVLPAGSYGQVEAAPHAAQYTHAQATADAVASFLGWRERVEIPEYAAMTLAAPGR